MKVHEQLETQNVLVGFSPPPGKALEALIEEARARAASGEEPAAFGREELGLVHGLKIDGLAIFHNLSERVEEPVLLIALSRQGVSLDSGPPVGVLALLISPIKDSGTHLQLLSKLSSLLRSRRVRENLLAAQTSEDVLRAIRREEEAGPESYWVLSREEVLAELQTSGGGLTEEEAARRLAETGPNLIQRVRRQPLLQRFLANFVNMFAVLLWVAAFLAYVSGARELAIAIPVVILVNAVFSFVQEYRAERAIEALEMLLPPLSRVVRGGVMREVAATDLVPGDVVLIGAGDQIAADARLIETHDFRVDNSVLTGESRPSYKFDEPVEDGAQFLWTELPNLVFAGTAAVSGEARGVVIATGMNTQLGHIAALTQAVREEPSPLQRELRGVTRFVAVLAFAIGAFFFTIGLATGKLTLAASLIFAIGIIVAFVPEGLLPTLSLSLAIGVQRMAAKNALVKKLSSVETLGAATVICTDKTGTLTTNEMMVQRLWLDGRVLTVTGSGYDPRGEIVGSAGPLAAGEISGPNINLVWGLLCRCSVLCSNTSLMPPSGGQDRWRVKGDPSEGALMTLAAKTDCPIDEVQRRNPRLQIFPFESVRKRMATINATPEGSLACWVKGAPEGIIPLCTHVAASDGSSRPLTHQDRSALINAYNDFATHGLRILALAWKPVERADIGQNEAESGLTLIAVAGMIDPPRPEVPGAIKLCHEAGIRVVMITGDYGPTARAIAAQIGMRIDRRFHLITSEQLTRMTDMRLKGMLARGGEVVFARSSPEDKLRIVRLLRGMGEVVAVTGDGVNDAPALKQAHIGVAMGQRGTEVSREAASMVLTDDNFASIVAAIEEGRTIYRNIKRFITYIFASNIPEAVPFVLFILFGIPLPLTIMQILAVDLGADLLPALALGAEPPEPGIMSVPPRDPKTRLIDRPVLLRALYSGTFETMAAMGAFFFSYWLSGWSPGLPLQGEGLVYERATTMCWAGIIAAEAGNVFNMRTYRASLFKTDPFSNPLLWPGLASMVVVIGLVSYVPFMQYFFGTAALRPAEIAYLCAMPFFLIAADEARKWFVRRSTEQKG